MLFNRGKVTLAAYETYHSQGVDIDAGGNVVIKLGYISIDPSLLKGEVEIYRPISSSAGIPRVHA